MENSAQDRPIHIDRNGTIFFGGGGQIGPRPHWLVRPGAVSVYFYQNFEADPLFNMDTEILYRLWSREILWVPKFEVIGREPAAGSLWKEKMYVKVSVSIGSKAIIINRLIYRRTMTTGLVARNNIDITVL
jgi:hypothetical protein